jgi:hypothetical protein
MPADTSLIDELRADVKTERRTALVDAFIAKPTPSAIADKAVELLEEDVRAIDED